VAKLDLHRGEMQIAPAALLHLGIGNYAGAYWNLYRVDFYFPSASYR